MHVEVWNDAISRRDPEDPVPAGWGVQEERPLWEGAAGSVPHQPGSFQTGTFITHSQHLDIILCTDIIISTVLIINISDVFRNLWVSHRECQTGSTAGSKKPIEPGLLKVLLWGYLYWYMSAKTAQFKLNKCSMLQLEGSSTLSD